MHCEWAFGASSVEDKKICCLLFFYVELLVELSVIVGSLLKVSPISAARMRTCSAKSSLRLGALG